MKKKIFSILLTSILAVTVLAGCGNSADTSTEKSVTITNVSYDPTRELYSANFSESIGKGKQDRTLKLYSHTVAAVSKHLKLQTETRQTL